MKCCRDFGNRRTNVVVKEHEQRTGVKKLEEAFREVAKRETRGRDERLS